MREYVFNVRGYNARYNRYFGVRYNICATTEKDAFLRVVITATENLAKWECLDSIQLITIVER